MGQRFDDDQGLCFVPVACRKDEHVNAAKKLALGPLVDRSDVAQRIAKLSTSTGEHDSILAPDRWTRKNET
jgi:hypothetical protein